MHKRHASSAKGRILAEAHGPGKMQRPWHESGICGAMLPVVGGKAGGKWPVSPLQNHGWHSNVIASPHSGHIPLVLVADVARQGRAEVRNHTVRRQVAVATAKLHRLVGRKVCPPIVTPPVATTSAR